MQIDCVSRHDNEAKGNWDDNSSNFKCCQQFAKCYTFNPLLAPLQICTDYIQDSWQWVVDAWIDSGIVSLVVKVGNTGSLDQQEMVDVVCWKKNCEVD